MPRRARLVATLNVPRPLGEHTHELSHPDGLHGQHQEALRRIKNIKNQLKKLEDEKKALDTESYVKARVLSTTSKIKDPERFEEFGRRLKDIQQRLREIETTKRELQEERDRISR